MILRYHHLQFADHVELAAIDDEALHVLHVCGRGVRMDLPSGWMSLWLPLAGQLRVDAPAGSWELCAGEAQLWREGRVWLGSRLPCTWLALAGPLVIWKQFLGETELFPWDGRASRSMRRMLVRLVRCTRGDDHYIANTTTPLLTAFCAEIIEQQSHLQAYLPRCSGRTLHRRQQTLLRLLRVQQQIRRRPDTRIDLAQLARSASYSP
ncbi:MAG: hypothetical protein ACREPE_16440, partial [Lysobacter sp.]